MESGILRGGRAGPTRPIAIGAPRPGAESSAAKSSEDRWGCTPMPATPELRTEAEARQSAVAQLHRGMPRALYHLQQQHHHHHMGAGLDVGLLHHVGHAFHSHGASSAHHQLQQQQQTVLQRLGLEHLQHYLRYSSAEPLELTACPLDLSVKSGGGRHLHELEHPITPPCTPSPSPGAGRPPTPEEARSPPKKKQQEPLRGPQLLKKSKATRKLTFDEENSSPVSGTIIRQLGPDETLVVRKGDIDPAFNVVEITEEAKAELAKIENHIGDYVCRLCKELYEDAFGLAQHRCSRIVHVEYRCPECDKVFNCPANLASHRRWHKPRPPKDVEITVKNEDPVSGSGDDSSSEQFPCPECGKKFRRMAYLRKHQAVHQVQVD